VGAGLADRCGIQVAYAIGVAQPLAVYVDLYGTDKVDQTKLEVALAEVMDLSPRGIRKQLELDNAIYERTAAYGHFGRPPEPDGGFSWERLDLVDSLKTAFA
jgi:S-adenosylmethionine synthetase